MINYDWVDIHKELAERLLDFKEDRSELVSIVKEAYTIAGFKMPKLANEGEFDDIDPFSFYALFHKSIALESKINILNAFKDLLSLNSKVPSSFDGVPIMNNQNATYYQFDEERLPGINKLWDIFESSLNYSKDQSKENEKIFVENFNKFHDMKGNKRSKVTIALFWINPEFYISLDNPTLDYIENGGDINADIVEMLPDIANGISGEDYLIIMKMLKDAINNQEIDVDSFLDLSTKAWEYANENQSQKVLMNTYNLLLNISKGDTTKQVDFYTTDKIKNNNSRFKSIRYNDVIIETSKHEITETGIKQLIELLSVEFDDMFIEHEYMFNDLIKLNQGQKLMRLAFFESKEKLFEYAKTITNSVVNSRAAVNYSKNINVAGTDYYYRLNEIADYISLLVGLINKFGDDEDKIIVEIEKDKYKEVDKTRQYWVYSPGSKARLFDKFVEESVMAIAWDELGDLSNYDDRDKIESSLVEIYNLSKRPYNDSKALDDFYRVMNVGDIVYAKEGNKVLVGRGEVVGDYYFDDSHDEYKHRRKIKWTHIGSWDLRSPVANKVLTDFSTYYDWLGYAEALITGDNMIENNNEELEFISWLSEQVNAYNQELDPKTVAAIKNCLIDISNYFNEDIFMMTSIDLVKELQEEVNESKDYTRYSGTKNTAFNYYMKYLETKPTLNLTKKYNINDFLAEVFMDKEKVDVIQSVLRNKKNLILKGAPGVGKTFIADRLAYLLMGEKDESRVQMVQFHQSYSYEDFIEGYRPKVEQEGFELKQGPFIKFCRKAERDKNRDYFFIIDEINRGNLSKIFGELLMLIETDKRDKKINLLYSNEKFSVPSNVHIIGMMNTADRSLALLDYALRRRFSFIDLKPAFNNSGFLNYVDDKANNELLKLILDEVRDLNKLIKEDLGAGFEIGHSYFIDDSLNVNINQRVSEIVEFEIIPLIEEYWFDEELVAKERINKFRELLNAI